MPSNRDATHGTMNDVSTVLFDLGGTLVEYYQRHEFGPILEGAISGVRRCLVEAGLPCPDDGEVRARVAEENHEAPDHEVRPLTGRLARIFGLTHPMDAELCDRACRAFLAPILARGMPYGDAVPTLLALRGRGIRTAIVSNSPWGSPSNLWHEELQRLGLDDLVDVAVFCADVGWRKPDRRIFERALRLLGAGVQEAAFVGDDPRWDVAGPLALGMRAILVRRGAPPPEAPPDASTPLLSTLSELPALIVTRRHASSHLIPPSRVAVDGERVGSGMRNCASGE